MNDLLREREMIPGLPRAFTNRALSPSNGIVANLQRRENTLTGHSGCVNTVCFTPDGSRLISGSDDLHLIIWDWQNGACSVAPFRYVVSVSSMRMMVHRSTLESIFCSFFHIWPYILWLVQLRFVDVSAPARTGLLRGPLT
jgi:WD40 repeat protein